MPFKGIEIGLAGPVHFCAASKRQINAGSVVHFAAAILDPPTARFKPKQAAQQVNIKGVNFGRLDPP